MRSALAVALASLLVATPALAAQSMEMANGYGWIGASRDVSPEQLGQMFCTARISGDMTPVEKFYAPKLRTLLAEVPSPAMVPWQGVADHPQRCDIRILNGFNNTVGVLVEVSYAGAGHQWADTLNLERTPDSWLLNNVFYDGGGNLRFRLAALVP
jgi:hypothetical protein